MLIVSGFALYVIAISVSVIVTQAYPFSIRFTVSFFLDPGDQKQVQMEMMTTSQKVLNIAFLIFFLYPLLYALMLK